MNVVERTNIHFVNKNVLSVTVTIGIFVPLPEPVFSECIDG